MTTQLSQSNKQSNIAPAAELSISRKSEDDILHEEHIQADKTLQMKSVNRASNGGAPPASSDGDNTLNNSRLFDYLKVQSKLTIGAPNDKYEQEADRVADQVMNTPATDTVQRSCSSCGEEEYSLQSKPLYTKISPLIQHQPTEEEEIQTKPLTQRQPVEDEEALIQSKAVENITPEVTPSISFDIQSLQGGGHPLSGAEQSFFEPRFGSNFSGVRVHSDARAASLARSVNARAFTHGSNVVLGAGEYSAGSLKGRKLMAHELTHVMQQQEQQTDHEESEGEKSIQSKLHSTVPGVQKSEIEDTVTSQTQDPASGVFSGEVTRREFVPAEGTTPERTLGTLGGIRIEFDPGNCTITLPSRLTFQHPNSTNWPSCGGDQGQPIPATQVPQGDFDSIKERYMRESRNWLNGWYNVRISGVEHNCSNRDMEINVVIDESNADATTTVVIANTSGRSCATPQQVTIHAREPGNGGDVLNSRLVHESGHMALGYFDEYSSAAGNPNPESERSDDYSAAGSATSYRDWMLLHQRHFSFVTEFLQQAIPGCTAELVEIHRPDVNFEFHFDIGGSSYAEGAFDVGLGLDLGIPLNRHRDFQFFIGPHLRTMISLSDIDRIAFTAGLRAGLQYTTGPSSGGFQLSAFGELGGGTFSEELPGSTSFDPQTERFTAPYGLAGGSIGYQVPPESGSHLFLGGTAGFGSTFGLSEEDVERHGNSEWFFVAFNIGYQWR
ncbi:MAG: DUF4157 domain-containing protein [Candidatus Scalindua sp.]|nr:DUF4157 domain-containing protein [Candidatus Scalindua sp.]